jgi:hypothetical protein
MSDSLAYNLRLRATWDDESPAAVDTPFGLFFGAGLFDYFALVFTTVDALPAGINNEETHYYSYFPMPFDNRALLELVNNGDTQIENISYTIRYTTLAEPQTGVGKFHAYYNRNPDPAPGVDFLFLEETGAGHLVGIVQTLRGYSDSQWYLEGDERIFIDGSDTPAIHGTGTEDFYNGGWYFEFGTFTQPVHGMTMEYDSYIDPNSRSNTCYRYLLSDTIPFSKSIVAGIEHGGWNEYDADFDSLALYYKIDRPLSVLTDELDVGNSDSETEHGYTTSNVAWSGTTTAPYEVDLDGMHNVDEGNWLGMEGSCQFTMKIDPSNSGLLLRRRINYGVPQQKAMVYVDGQAAGAWFEPGSNTTDGSRNVEYPVFRDSEFMIAASLSKGKTELTINITNASTESEWTEYYYKVLSFYSLDEPNVGDFDADGDVDQSDFSYLQACMTGKNQEPEPYCTSADMDSDGDVDLYDVARFEACVTGPGIPADESCLDVVIVDLPHDVDDDGDVDLTDFGAFQQCLSGPHVPYPAGCEEADLDKDGDVDVEDKDDFLQCFSGASQGYDPYCAGE